MRGTLALVIAVLGYTSITFSLAQLVVRTDPIRAHRLAPYDGRVTAQLAGALTGVDSNMSSRRRGADVAKLSLRQDPTAIAAVAALGVNALTRDDVETARRLFGYAEKLSRREATTQLWMIEDKVARGDVVGALRHHDILLRTKPAMAGVLFPVLTAASSEPAVRSELIRILATKPAWSDGFISFAVANGKDPRATASLLQALRRENVNVPYAAQASVVGALLVSEAVDLAWSYYVSIRPGADRSSSRDPRFSAQLEAPTPFDWVAINDGGVTTSIGRGVFDFSVPASVAGSLLQQVQLLPAGDYRLSGHSEGIDQAAGAGPYWALTCRDGRKLGRVDMPNSSQTGGNFAGNLRVSADCSVQVLTLIARPSEAVGGLSGQIDRVQITPLR